MIPVFIVLALVSPLEATAPLMPRVLQIKRFADLYPGQILALFVVAHFLASSFAIPTGCTILNLMSGLILGFWLGIPIVYAITLVSATTGYAVGKFFIQKRRSPGLLKIAEKLAHAANLHQHRTLVLLRLSPLVPFSLVNLACGLTNIPFGPFLASTAAGIFFDVVLLNGIGSSVIANEFSVREKGLLVAFFLILFFVTGLIKKNVQAKA